MPVSIVVGGQFGSEGKGKVALEIVRRDPSVAAVVRVGGSNSGHTAYDAKGKIHALRQIPASAIDGNVLVVLPPGAFIDVEIFHQEILELGLTPDRVAVSPYARIITQEHKIWERESKLNQEIGSTESGTGAAVLAMAARGARNFPLTSLQAYEVPAIAPYTTRWEDTVGLLRDLVSNGKRVVIEGTQGFGLSLLQGGYWPKATSRDTTAAGFLAETGLSPRDVDDITLVIRCHPIRVSGDSGPLLQETTWEEIAKNSGSTDDYREFTTVTKKIRRVGLFDPVLVRRAIAANNPTRIALNHVDYIDFKVRDIGLTNKARDFIEKIEEDIGRKIDWFGLRPEAILTRKATKI